MIEVGKKLRGVLGRTTLVWLSDNKAGDEDNIAIQKVIYRLAALPASTSAFFYGNCVVFLSCTGRQQKSLASRCYEIQSKPLWSGVSESPSTSPKKSPARVFPS
jgi:hypothetical protein